MGQMTDDNNAAMLWQDYAASRNSSIREKLVLNYLNLVKFIVGRMPLASLPGIDYDDLMGYGVLGLIDAVEKFDADRGVKFETYATTRIRGAIIDQLRSMDWAPRSVRQHARQIEQATIVVESRMNRYATDDDIAAELGIDVATLERWIWEISKASYMSLDELVAVDDDANVATLLDFLSDSRSPDPEVIVETGELERFLAEAIDNLPERERFVISMYYYDELTVKEIARVLGVSESRVSQLHTRAMMRLRADVHQSVCSHTA